MKLLELLLSAVKQIKFQMHIHENYSQKHFETQNIWVIYLKHGDEKNMTLVVFFIFL